MPGLRVLFAFLKLLYRLIMTIRIKVECDARGCFNETEVRDNYDSDIESEGWFIDPDDGYYHYCPTCWPKVEKEIKEREAEEENIVD